MSQIENKMDDFMPFGGEIRSKYPEDDETVQHAIIDACFAALDDIMFGSVRPELTSCPVIFTNCKIFAPLLD